MQIWSDNNHDHAANAAKLCSDWMSGSHSIMQTIKFVIISVTTMTLGQGQRKVIKYISPDLYFPSTFLVWRYQAIKPTQYISL